MDVNRIEELLVLYSQIDGWFHKAWCLDQIARAFYDEKYDEFRREYEEDGKYSWDEGIEP